MHGTPQTDLPRAERVWDPRPVRVSVRRLGAAIGVACVLAATAAAGDAAAGTVTFTSDRCANDPDRRCHTGIWLVSDDGTGLRRLNVPNEPNPGSVYSPTWSPDGREIAHLRSDPGAQGLWATAADGSSTRQLLEAPNGAVAHMEDPVWSPDGSSIAFSGLPTERTDARFSERSIYVVPAAGGPVRRLTSGLHDVRPVFTPDSRRVAFVRFKRPSNPAHSFAADGIVSVPVEGGPEARVFLGGPLGEPAETSFELFTAQLGYAPDGRSIAVASLGRVYLAFAETNEMREVAAFTGDAGVTLAWAWETRPRLVVASGPSTGPPPPLSIFDVSDLSLPPLQLTRDYADGPAGDRDPDWVSALLERPIVDVSPPVVDLSLGPPPTSRVRSAGGPRRVSRRALDLRAADSSGVRRIEAVFGRESVARVRSRRCRRSGRGQPVCRRVVRRRTVCRFATPRGFSSRRSCRRPISLELDSLVRFRSRVARLPVGRYRMRVRVRDVYGRAAGTRLRRVTLQP